VEVVLHRDAGVAQALDGEAAPGHLHVKYELAARRGGVDVLLQTAEADIAPLEVRDRVD
jgi:hypothetical protein